MSNQTQNKPTSNTSLEFQKDAQDRCPMVTLIDKDETINCTKTFYKELAYHNLQNEQHTIILSSFLKLTLLTFKDLKIVFTHADVL